MLLMSSYTCACGRLLLLTRALRGVQVVAVGMQRPRKNGYPLTEVYGTDGGLLLREVGVPVLRLLFVSNKCHPNWVIPTELRALTQMLTCTKGAAQSATDRG